MRIVSLVPSATEILFALGAGDEVIAVTHECDHPPEAQELPAATHDRLPADLGPAEIDAAVRERTAAGESIYGLDEELLAELEPDLIVTQALCEVCAVSFDDVTSLARRLDPQPEVVALDPHTLGEVLGDVGTLARATGRATAGAALAEAAAVRIDRVREAVQDAERPGVAALEWLDPVYAAGHWVPQLIEYAGGIDVLGLAGEPSEPRTWEEVAAAAPDVVVLMPCGYGAGRALAEAEAFAGRLAALGAREIAAVDAAAYFSRPGPRLVDGLEVLGHLLHPGLVPEPEAATRALPLT